MICPHCNAEYRPGFTVCSDCDIELVEELGSAGAEPGLAQGPVALEPFHETRSSDELAALLESFEENGIPYVVQAGTALALLSSSVVDAEGLPEAWHARILVASSRLKDAQTILRLLYEQARSAATAPRPDRGVLS